MIHYVFVYDVLEDFDDNGGERQCAISEWVSPVTCFENRGDISTKPVGWEKGCSEEMCDYDLEDGVPGFKKEGGGGDFVWIS